MYPYGNASQAKKKKKMKAHKSLITAILSGALKHQIGGLHVQTASLYFAATFEKSNWKKSYNITHSHLFIKKLFNTGKQYLSVNTEKNNCRKEYILYVLSNTRPWVSAGKQIQQNMIKMFGEMPFNMNLLNDTMLRLSSYSNAFSLILLVTIRHFNM